MIWSGALYCEKSEGEIRWSYWTSQGFPEQTSLLEISLFFFSEAGYWNFGRREAGEIL
jgi:hypothetical protein